mmetsp:Transcript_19711/g.23453  ORF Transcript_19711/g.23453 Transcript_19711/m.23453 type:complete len:429 (-) Transcript_19711:297-1583(-)
MSNSSETSVYCVHAVLYESVASGDRDWQPLGNAEWAEMHIFKDTGKAGIATYRMVAWLPETTEVVLNSNLLATSAWNCNAGDFAELVNPNETVYGFYFPDDQTASESAEAVMGVVKALKEAALAASPPAAPASPTLKPPAAPPPAVPMSAAARRQSLAIAVESQATTPEASIVDISNQVENLKFMSKSTFTAVGEGGAGSLSEHALHVSYNEERAAYEGLPEEWKHINQQFGVPLSQVPKSVVEGYVERIPSVLLMMERFLKAHNGRDQVGIFRLAPDAEDCAFAKKQINAGEFKTTSDVNVIANLIKVWFRDMPVGLYNDIPNETIYKVAEMPYDAAIITAEYNSFSEPSRSLILWLLDMMADIVTNEANNKMGAKNMAIVLSPNLFQINNDNPMAALTMAQKVADFTTRLLAARLMETKGYDAKVQ